SIFVTEPEEEKSRNDGEISLGMAYRPDDSRWIILERFDFEFENASFIDLGLSRRIYTFQDYFGIGFEGQIA
ncbi:MAG: hypothetical protein JSV11_00390, partial [Nitrospiraceae bacterium]